MASENKIKRSQLADCTNIQSISRPRRSCGSYASSSLKSQQPRNPLSDANCALSGSSSYGENEEPLIDNGSFATPKTVLPSVGSLRFPDDAERADQGIKVYDRRLDKEGRSSQVTSSCPPLGRSSHKRTRKTGKSSEPKNPLKNVEDSHTPARGSHDQNKLSLSGNDNYKQNFGTPQEVIAAVDNFQFPDDNEDTDFQNTKVQSLLQESDGRSLEKVCLSCPPLGRGVCDSAAGESTEVQKRCSLVALDTLPKSGNSK
ncbi:hypothetical protein KI387_012452, partial [Taxus chinensis]